MVCGEIQEHRTKPEPLVCYFCGETKQGTITCKNNHFICDTCRGMEAMTTISNIAQTTRIHDPGEIAEYMMSHPSIPMIGGEHHAIVATSIIAALKNAGPVYYNNQQVVINDDLIERAVDRTWINKLPSCMCQSYGSCATALAAGSVFSMLTDATCSDIRKKERQISMEVASYIASEIAWFRTTCCKLSVRLAIEGAGIAIKEHFGIELPHKKTLCHHMSRNPYKCLGTICPYFDSTSEPVAGDGNSCGC